MKEIACPIHNDGDCFEDSDLENINKGLTVWCISHGRLFFLLLSVLIELWQTRQMMYIGIFEKYLFLYFDIDSHNLGYACSNWIKYLIQGKNPPLSLAQNDLFFREIPP